MQMMLHLPPGIESENFNGVMGFTIRGEEEKTFEIPLLNLGEKQGREFPVYLNVEYGEHLKHFSGEIMGWVEINPAFILSNAGPQIFALWVLAVVIVFMIRNRRHRSLGNWYSRYT